jgi:predicted amidohydrolase
MNNLQVAAIQFDISWENPQENYRKIDLLLESIEHVDLIILPEMFTTGFSMAPERVAERYHYEMPTLQWLRAHAKAFNAVVIGSISCEDGGKFYNRCLAVFPEGHHFYYDKNYLFSIGQESEHYTAGQGSIIFEWKGWKIKPLVCYDLRFPEHARNEIIDDEYAYDLLIYMANWPSVRIHPWNTLLMARAIENQAYVVGVNRVGDDGSAIAHNGSSAVNNFKGEAIATLNDNEEGLIQTQLDLSELRSFREKFPALRDRKGEGRMRGARE